MALVDQRDISIAESHMVQDIFKDVMCNLRNVDGFDLVSKKNIQPYRAVQEHMGHDEFGEPNYQNSPHSFDFDNYWYRKFIYDFDGSPKVIFNKL
jgi:hypothetical protein